MKTEVLTFAEEQSRDKAFLQGLRDLRRPSGVDDLERFALDSRRVWAKRHPQLAETFAQVGLSL